MNRVRRIVFCLKYGMEMFDVIGMKARSILYTSGVEPEYADNRIVEYYHRHFKEWDRCYTNNRVAKAVKESNETK